MVNSELDDQLRKREYHGKCCGRTWGRDGWQGQQSCCCAKMRVQISRWILQIKEEAWFFLSSSLHILISDHIELMIFYCSTLDT